MPIPRRIIQTHKSPDIMAASRATWQSQHPDYEYLFFDDAQCRAFIAERLPGLLATYDRLPLPVQRSDLFRYAAVHELGGLYADVDTECCAPLHSYVNLEAEHFVAGLEMQPSQFTGEPEQYLRQYAAPFQLLQWTFAAPARHPALAVLLRRIEFLVSQATDQDLTRFAEQARYTLELTGPMVFTQVLTDFMSGTRAGLVAVLPRLAWGAWPREQARAEYAGEIKVKHAFHGGWKVERVRSMVGTPQAEAVPQVTRYEIRR